MLRFIDLLSRRFVIMRILLNSPCCPWAMAGRGTCLCLPRGFCFLSRGNLAMSLCCALRRWEYPCKLFQRLRSRGSAHTSASSHYRTCCPDLSMAPSVKAPRFHEFICLGIVCVDTWKLHEFSFTLVEIRQIFLFVMVGAPVMQVTVSTEFDINSRTFTALFHFLLFLFNCNKLGICC